MFSRQRSRLRQTAAWRISAWPTLAFAIGTAIAFAIAYMLVARGIHERSDEWLIGETEVLSEVSANTPRDDLYDRLMEEVAEHASREVPTGAANQDQSQDSVFFLLTRPGQEPLWVGPQNKEPFLDSLSRVSLNPGIPKKLRVAGFSMPFHVAYHSTSDGGRLYLGFADVALHRFLNRLILRFAIIWLCMGVLGFLISFTGAFRTLLRVERITETAERIGSEDLARRVPEGRHSDEISRLVQTFNYMLDRIQASVHQLRVLTDSVAHDLKSPITSIRGSLEVALTEPGDGWQETVAVAIEKLDRLSQTLNTALDLAEADAGALQLHREPVELAEIVEQLVELYQPALNGQRHIMHCDLQPGATVYADRALLNRVLANLLDNEIAHVPPGRQVWIEVRARDNEGELVIADNGPGFPADVRARAFERFVKGNQSNGHGLGLAFVNAVAQAHGGRVRISDREQGGTRICVTLPLTRVLVQQELA
jgi:signal transduction histidine kinase